MARRGTTLIELLAGLVVLGILLVAVGMARARFMRQAAEADRRLADVSAADALLARWLNGPPAQVPLHGQGTLDGSINRMWRTRVKDDPSATSLLAVVVRLEIVNASGGRGPNGLAEFGIDFLLHDVRTDQPPKALVNSPEDRKVTP